MASATLTKEMTVKVCRLFLFVWLLLASTVFVAPAFSAASLVNTARNSQDTSATTIATSSTIAVTAGNLIVVCVAQASTTLDNQVTGIADTAGNTYAKVVSSGGSPGNLEMWYAYNITGHATNTITATYTAARSFRRIIARQYSGIITTDPKDKTDTGTGTDTSPVTGATDTTTQANELLLGCDQLSNARTHTVGTTRQDSRSHQAQAGSC
jgi:hypothetical protein